MLGIFLGSQNSGKTLAMSYFGHKYYRDGYKIYSNYNLKYPHNKLTKKFLIELVTGKVQLKKTVFLIDEIYLMIDSRSFGNKTTKLLTYLLLQINKRQCHLFGTAQFFNTVEKRFRENCHFLVFNERVIKYYDDYVSIASNDRFLPKKILDLLYIRCNIMSKNGLAINLDTKEFYIKAQPVFDLYDTTELIGLEDE